MSGLPNLSGLKDLTGLIYQLQKLKNYELFSPFF